MNNTGNAKMTAAKLRKGHEFLTTSPSGAGVLAKVLDVRHGGGRVLLALSYGEHGQTHRATITMNANQTIYTA